jgi:hypothetical protein
MDMNKYRKLHKSGVDNMTIARVKEIAKREADRVESESIDKAFIYMLAIPLNVLVNDYWSKSAKKRAPKFIKDVLSLYESVQEGYVTNEELTSLLEEYAGVKVTAEWLKEIRSKKSGVENG